MKKTTQKNLLTVKIHQQYDDYKIAPPFCYPHHFQNQNVADTLREHIDEWESAFPVFVSAATGSGKSTLAYRDILSKAKEKGKNVLLLSNRVSICEQQKKKIMEILNCPLRDLLTDKGVREQDVFGYASVLTYHRLPSFLSNPENQKWIENIGYVICDECHFFTSDAMFNGQCDSLLKLIVKKLYFAVRIYMTATPWDTVHRICEAEENHFLDYRRTFVDARNRLYLDKRYMHFYSFDSDFSNVDLNFFEDFSEIIPLIHAGNDERWLVFIDNKEKAQSLKSKFKVPTLYIDAESKSLEEWQKLISDEKFEAKILLATSVIDCGINLIDPTLKNIVIMSDNRVAMMQMAGRKRCQEGERINVWVQEPSKQKLANRKKRLEHFVQLELEFDSLICEKDKQRFATQLWYSDDDIERILFVMPYRVITKNKSAFVYIHRLLNFYEKLSNGETTFIDEVLKWFGKPPLNANAEIDGFYELHKNEILDDNAVESLRKLIVKAYKRFGKSDRQPSRADILKHGALNNRLKEMNLPYEIQNKQGEWRLIFVCNSDSKETHAK